MGYEPARLSPFLGQAHFIKELSLFSLPYCHYDYLTTVTIRPPSNSDTLPEGSVSRKWYNNAVDDKSMLMYVFDTDSMSIKC